MSNDNAQQSQAYLLDNQLEEARYAAEASEIDTEERSRQAERYAEGVEAAINDLHDYSQVESVTLDPRGELWRAEGAISHQPNAGHQGMSVTDGLAISAVLAGGAVKNAYENTLEAYQSYQENAMQADVSDPFSAENALQAEVLQADMAQWQQTDMDMISTPPAYEETQEAEADYSYDTAIEVNDLSTDVDTGMDFSAESHSMGND